MYDISLSDKYKDLIGRLKISYAHKDRAVRCFMEKYYPKFELKEILAEPYSGNVFSGIRICMLNFQQLKESLVNSN